MSGTFKYKGEPLGQELIASIAGLLSASTIPNVLWGNYMLTFHGVPSLVEDISFVIPDGVLAKATSILKAAKFSPCFKGQQCVHAHDTVQYRSSSPPSEHFHLLDPNVIMLFRKSEMLWKVDDFQTSSKIILASNRSYLPGNEPGLGGGAFPQSVRTVRVPSADCLVEAYSALFLRNWSNQYGSFWVAMLCYVMQYVDEKGRLDLNKVVDSRYGRFYLDLWEGKIGGRQAMINFKNAMES